MGYRPALLFASALQLLAVVLAQDTQAPTPAPYLVPPSTGLGGIAQSFALRPYLNGTTLQPDTVLQNITYRFVGEGLDKANSTFQQVIRDATGQLLSSDNVVLELKFRPGVEAPIYGPDGKNGTGAAFAPTPGQVAEGFSRKLLQGKPFNKDSLSNRYTLFMSIDVEIVAKGNDDSSIVQIDHPVQLNGYLTVLMAQKGINVQATPVNMSITNSVLPMARRMAFPVTYVLGTVLQVSGTGISPINTQGQTMMLLTLLGLYGSQSNFLYNRIGAVWQDSINDTVRLGIYTYTTTSVQSMNEIAGGDIPTLMSQVAQATGANFTVTVIESKPLGTQEMELSGSSAFQLDVATPQANRTRVQAAGGGGLSDGALAGILVGSIVGFLIAVAVLLLIAFLVHRKRKGAATVGGKEYPLGRSILGSGGGGNTGDSSGFISKGSTDGSSPATGPGTPVAHKVHPLSDAWNIDPAELAVCQHPDGKDWLLGSGSFGHVYRGLRGGVQDVAIKQLIKPGDMHLRMFEKEVALLRHLNFDRNLVQFYGACVADNNLMLVLEYMDGGDLKEALGNDPIGAFSWYGRGGSILIDVARGLHFLHTNKVAHRDLKTKNILLNKAGEAKVGDVGLAKLVGSQLLSTQLETAGTFAYAAPELLLGEPCDQSADLYSFGVIMWEVVTHEIPVRGALRSVEVPKEAPQLVADLIASCLKRCPKSRPTAKECFEILQTVLSTPVGQLPPVIESVESQATTTSRGLFSNETISSVLTSTSKQSEQAIGIQTEESAAPSALSSGPHPIPELVKRRLNSA